MVTALIALAAFHALPPGELRLACTLAEAAASESVAEPTRLTIVLGIGTRSIDSARVDGPPLFSSTHGLQVFSGSTDRGGGLRIDSSQPSPRELRWSPRLRGERIELVRGNSHILLGPVAGESGSYGGSWELGPTRMGGNFFMEGSSGSIRCLTATAGSTGQ